MSSLYEQALQAIRDLFGDTSVSQEETKRDLRALKDEIGSMIDSLEA